MKTALNTLFALSFFLLLIGCADKEKKLHYAYPDDITNYKVEAGDSNQYIAELLTASGNNISNDFPTHEIEESWDTQITNLVTGAFPSSIDTTSLIVWRINHDISELQSQFKTLYMQQQQSGEIRLMGLEKSDTIYWLKNVATDSYGIVFLPVDPASLIEPVSESAILEICNNTCLDKGSLDYSLSPAGSRETKTIYATFDTVILDSSLNVTAIGDTEDVSYTLDSRLFYSPLIGKVAEAVSFTDGQKSLFADFSSLLAKTNIAIDSKYIIE